MAKAHEYANPPIAEAIIDLRVQLPSEVGLDQLEELYRRIADDYPAKQTCNLAQGIFQVGPHVTASASTQPIGLLFKNEDGTQVVQALLHGFTFSRLTPYQGWERFRDEARRLWQSYMETVRPTHIDRLAVRYINRIDIPLPIDDFKHYLRTLPEVSPDLPQGLSGLFMQLTIPQTDMQAVALLNEAMIEPTKADLASIVLDIDLFRTEEVPQSEDAMWDYFDKLHVRKNEVFEACITDASRELFN